MSSDFFDMFGQLHNLVSDFESLRPQIISNLMNGNRAEQMSLLVGLGGDNSFRSFDRLRSLFEPFAFQNPLLRTFGFLFG
jgi:hypothetical protein